MRYKILVVGSASLELVENVARLPYTGETMVSDGEFFYAPGGRGAVSATTFSRLGGEALLCAAVGIDEMGAKLDTMYADEGLDTRFIVPSKTSPTGFTSVRRNEKGEAQTIIFHGANRDLSASDVEDAFTSLPDAVYVNFDVPCEAVYKACEMAAKKNIPIFIDAGPYNKEIEFEKLGNINILTMDTDECYRLSGIKADTIQDCLRACIHLASINKVNYIIIKLGARGVFVYDNTLYHVLPSHKVETVDASGVGDIFSASLVYAYLQKQNILEAVRFATLASAISVTRVGSASSAPTLREVKQFAIKVKEAENE